MEKRLQDFIRASETIAGLRNSDERNPIFLRIEHPVTAQRYTVVCSMLEPSYLAVPINCTWIVTDPKHPLYRQALKLRDNTYIPPADVMPAPVRPDAALNANWWLIQRYLEIFDGSEYYVGFKGEQGDPGEPGEKGDPGDKGDKGDPGTVDYEIVAGIIRDLLAGRGALQFKNAQSSVFQSGTVTCVTELIFANGDRIPADSATYKVVAGAGTITGNVYTPEQTGEDYNVEIKATFVHEGVTYTAMLYLTAKAVKAVSLIVSGKTSLLADTEYPYMAEATMNDGSTLDVTALSTWSSTAGTMADNVLTAATSGGVQAVYDGITGKLAVTVAAQVVLKSIAITGKAKLKPGEVANYTVSATYSNGTTKAVTTPLTQTGGIGTLVGAALTADTTGGMTGALHATYTDGGVTKTADLSVQVLGVKKFEVVGAVSVARNSKTQYTAKVTYTDDSVETVSAAWSTVAALGTISASGELTASGASGASGDVTATATIGIQRTAHLTVTIQAVTLVSVAITAGPTDLSLGGTGTYTAEATYSDSSKKVVTATATWTSNIGTFAANVLTTNKIGAGTVTVSYTENGVTKTAVKNVNVTADTRPYYGLGTHKGAIPDFSAFIKALPKRGDSATSVVTADIAICAGPKEFMWYAYPKSLGLATFIDKSNGFPGGWDGAYNPGDGYDDNHFGPIEVLVDGVPYYAYRTDYQNLGCPPSNNWEVRVG